MYLQSYKQLIVWQKSINLVERIYGLTVLFPKEEIFGLSSQMKRATISIPSNIAEGQRRKDLPEFLQFLRIADASSAELETQIIISKKIFPNFNYNDIDILLEEIQKMLSVLIKTLQLKAKSSKLKTCTGFTLAELLIVMGIMTILATVGTVGFFGYKAKNDLSLAGVSTLSVVRDTQQKAISQENGEDWGVRFTNVASGDDYYEVFYGSPYSASRVVSKKVLGNNLNFGNPSSGKYYDIVFSAITGKVSLPAVITVVSQSAGAYEIDVKTNGTVLGGFETGLVGLWDFEEGSGSTAYDKAAYGNNGTWYGTGGRYTTGKIGNYSGTFNGSGDYISCGTGSSLNLGSVISTAFWIKGPNPNGSYASILSKYASPAGWIIQVGSLGPTIYMRIDTSAGANQTAGSITALDNTWHHVVFVINNGTKQYYLDGAPVYSGTYNVGDGFASPSTAFRIGTNIFIGQLDDVRLYSRALSAGEAKEIYEKGI